VSQRFFFGPFELDAGRGVLTRDGAPLAVGNRALTVLQTLLNAQGKVVTKAELMAAAWPGTVVEETNLSVQIAGLRKILEAVPGARGWIATASRIGYRFTGNLRVEARAPQAAAEPPADLAGKPSIAVLPSTDRLLEPLKRSGSLWRDGIAAKLDQLATLRGALR
jgi:DNA-binding winged helix-turn-helix (wHTH) protein